MWLPQLPKRESLKQSLTFAVILSKSGASEGNAQKQQKNPDQMAQSFLLIVAVQHINNPKWSSLANDHMKAV